MRQLLVLQSGAKFIIKWGSFFITKWGKIYYKVGQVLQSGAKLLQSGAGITKWGNYYKVGHNIRLLVSRVMRLAD